MGIIVRNTNMNNFSNVRLGSLVDIRKLDGLEYINIGASTGRAGRAVFSDDRYLYVALDSTPRIFILDKENGYTRAATITPGGSTAYQVRSDDNFVYLIHGSGSGSVGTTVIRKSNWTTVGIPSRPNSTTALYSDERYLYVSAIYGINMRVWNISNWSTTANIPAHSGQSHCINGDNDYVYVGSGSGRRLYISSKNTDGTFTSITTTPNIGGTPTGIYSDSEYVYVLHGLNSLGKRFTILRKHTWEIIDTEINISANNTTSAGHSIYCDDNFVYIIEHSSPYLKVIRKKTWELVLEGIDIPGTPYDIYGYDDIIYIAHAGGKGYSIFNKVFI